LLKTVQQVETIGDAYMAASGHDGRDDHAMALMQMAIGMLEEVRTIKYNDEEADVMKSSHLRIRVGLHTGPTYAGVVGTKCPRYCFFGDTVSCEPVCLCHGQVGTGRRTSRGADVQAGTGDGKSGRRVRC
jgi:hypothetical protein